MTRRALTVALAAVAFVLLSAGAAQAHGTPYCGHSRTGWLHVSAIAFPWTDSLGRHRHVVQEFHPWDRTPRWVSYVCPRHR